MPITLDKLVSQLKLAVVENRLTANMISTTIDSLVELGYKAYDSDKFPELKNTNSFDAEIGSTPASLAEALLWKLGRWPAYKSFVESYKTDELEVSSKGGVVFSAFAKHLQDNRFPIYDQHAIRSIWAICELEDRDREIIRSMLLTNSGAWRQAGSGDDGSCYKLFVEQVELICKENNLSHRELDMLLMPLGQALKKETRSKEKVKDIKSDLQRFLVICGRESG